MPDSHFLDLVKRLEASLDQGLQAVDSRFKAYRYFPYAPSHLPYALIYMGARTIRQGLVGSEVDDHVQTVNVLFVLGHATEGQDGELAEKLYQTYLPAFYDHFYDTQWLTSTTYPNPPDWLSPAEVRMAHGGWQRFQNSGTSGDQLGVLFSLSIPILFRKGNS